MSEVEIVLRLTAMGDILLTVPTLRAMAARNIEVHLLIHGRWAQLGEFLPAQVHYYNGTGTLMKLTAQFKKLQPLAVFDLQGKLPTIALRSMLNAPVSRSYKKRSLNEQFEAIWGRYPLRRSDERPVWQKYAETCGVTIDQPDASLNFAPNYLETCRNIIAEIGLTEKKFIILHPDASQPGKQIPHALLSAISEILPLPAIIVGTSKEPLPDTIACRDLRNYFSLYYLPGIIGLAATVISSDSGPMHLARAMSTPLIALFFQTCPSLGFAPIPADNVLVISEPLACKPCSLHGQNPVCPLGHFACRQVDLALTLDKIKEFLVAWL